MSELSLKYNIYVDVVLILFDSQIPNIGPLQLYGPSGDIKVSIRLGITYFF